jgi:hypothetical protein
VPERGPARVGRSFWLLESTGTSAPFHLRTSSIKSLRRHDGSRRSCAIAAESLGRNLVRCSISLDKQSLLAGPNMRVLPSLLCRADRM